MDIKNLHNKFLECNSIIDIDSRSIRNGSMFFAIKGDNFDGNKFANEALKKGAKIAVIDSNEINFSQKIYKHFFFKLVVVNFTLSCFSRSIKIS